jgi:hypothetical protein
MASMGRPLFLMFDDAAPQCLTFMFARYGRVLHDFSRLEAVRNILNLSVFLAPETPFKGICKVLRQIGH